ncbi:hypothetical protein K488DRAFT_75817 [Vararia minispora EC-137]|uniref:Uncharacterized protein n=1 Tax=Vararia minispora EC-137 TaxID=1314806 RepID=A0ACB8QYV3_9AGAM|nr:hypothetical protein K488DRAFT_75817 [Vararia minispora EC-137]
MDRFLSPASPEAIAHYHITENASSWDMDHTSPPEATIAHCASYKALSRFLSGADLIFPPRNRRELEGILHRYSYDAIHNLISMARSSLQEGGYSRICHFAEQSIRSMLNTGDNTAVLLALHRLCNLQERSILHPHHPYPPPL